MLFTHDPELIKALPGERTSSLVADMMSRLNSYCIQSASYSQPLTSVQERKRKIVNQCIASLKNLLVKERQLDSQNHYGHEMLRKEVRSLLEKCDHSNKLLANNPVVSERSLGYILYEAQKTTLHYQFNRFYKVSPQDQMDFRR